MARGLGYVMSRPTYAQRVFLRNAFASVAEELYEATFAAYDQHVISRNIHADEKHPIFLIGAFGLGREHGVMTAVSRQEGGQHVLPGRLSGLSILRYKWSLYAASLHSQCRLVSHKR